MRTSPSYSLPPSVVSLVGRHVLGPQPITVDGLGRRIGPDLTAPGQLAEHRHRDRLRVDAEVAA